MKWFVFLLCILPLFSVAQPVTPADYGLKAFSLNDEKLGTIRFYVDTVNLHQQAPLFIDVNGSGGYPLCLLVKGNDFAGVSLTFSPVNRQKTQEQYHYIILDKPGTDFCDTLFTAQHRDSVNMMALMRDYEPSPLYHEKLSLEWRVEATRAVIDFLVQRKFWDETRIVAFGYSEGGQVVPALALTDKRITHVVPVVGSVLNQFYSTVLDWRIKAANGQITHTQAQDSIDAFLTVVKDIYTYPHDTQKRYAGHTYQRWAGFCGAPPFESLVQLDIPIYMIVATADHNSPVYGMDYVQLDFLRRGKTNLTYEACIGCDHSLMTFEEGRPVKHYERYFDKVLDWVEKN